MTKHRPSFILAIIFSCGILAGKFLPVPFFIWVGLLATAVVLVCVNASRWPVFVGMFLLGAVLVNQAYRLPANSIAFLSDGGCQSIKAVEGVVDDKPRTSTWAQGEKIIFDLTVSRVLTPSGWDIRSGRVQVQMYKAMQISYGQQLRLSGKLYPAYAGKPNDKFSYRQYLQEQGIFWVLSAGKATPVEVIGAHKGNAFIEASFFVQEKIKSVFVRFLDRSEEGMITAMVLGDRSGLSQYITQPFVNTGTAHIIAISGMNMAIITALVFFLFKICGLPREGQFIGTILFLFFYAFLTGWSASVVRACLMSSIILGGFVFEREGEVLNSLGLAALVLLLINPKYLFDVGFQLSFGAVLAIVILYEPCSTLLRWLPDVLAKPMAVSLAAWAGTAPLIFYHFQMFTPVSIIANIPIVPLADLTVALGLGLGVSGLCNDWLALPFAGCLKVIFNLMLILAHWFDQIPWGHFKYG